ncbi:hypothetical protein ARTHRO9V_90080 [Arthrobacter sp. 9V]|nr:hypothetical protein ARTHRO9V_90080 [Arthrobacter sp. 9V]
MFHQAGSSPASRASPAASAASTKDSSKSRAFHLARALSPATRWGARWGLCICPLSMSLRKKSSYSLPRDFIQVTVNKFASVRKGIADEKICGNPAHGGGSGSNRIRCPGQRRAYAGQHGNWLVA